MGKRVPRTRASGTWTEARFRSFVRSLLRQGTLKWRPRGEAIKRAFVRKGINPATGRQCKLHRCCECNELFPQKDMRVDHIEPVVDPEIGFVSWDTFIERLFCEVDGLQVICIRCHEKKTQQENVKRRTGSTPVKASRKRSRKRK